MCRGSKLRRAIVSFYANVIIGEVKSVELLPAFIRIH
jgi:hypothetical protein